MAQQQPFDALATLSTALSAPVDSQQQADSLKTLRDHFESHPTAIPVLVVPLLQNTASTEETIFKRWVLDLLHFALHSPALSLDVRTQLAASSLDSLHTLLGDPSPRILKATIQCFSAVYPLLFLFLCVHRSNRFQWDTLTQDKSQILSLLEAPQTPAGVKLATIKFLQRVILVQTRGVSDPRLQNKADPNLTFCPSDHPFISVEALETEGTPLLLQMITLLYTSSVPDVLTAVINSFGALAKHRTSLMTSILPTFAQWTPVKLAGQHPSSIKSVEKALRILLTHTARSHQNAQYGREISEILGTQSARMEQAARDAHLWRPIQAEPPSQIASTSAAPSVAIRQESVANFDFATLPVSLVTDLIVANLQAIPIESLQAAIQAYRQRNAPAAQPPPTHTPVSASTAVLQPPLPTQPIADPAQSDPLPRATMPATAKDEPIDPLKMDIDDEEEIEYNIDAMNQDLEAGDQEMGDLGDVDEGVVGLQAFALPPPRHLSEAEKDALVLSSFGRVCASGGELELASGDTEDGGAGSQSASVNMWMMLLVRMVTRGPTSSESSLKSGAEIKSDEDIDEGAVDVKGKGRADQVDVRTSFRLRQTLCQYVLADFPSRVRLATIWMNEEWYNDSIQSQHNQDWRGYYDIWLEKIISSQLDGLTSKDKPFSRFLLDLPMIPHDTLDVLRELSLSTDRGPIGFLTLRDIVLLRPPLRAAAMKILLDLTTHPEKAPRGAAINTVKRWVPDTKPMDEITQMFALQMLGRLETRKPGRQRLKDEMDTDGIKDEDAKDEIIIPDEATRTPYLPEHLEFPVPKSVVLQHVELLFVLSMKVPDFLDKIFAAYGQMDESVQEAIQQLITALVRSLGSSHGKLLTLLRTFPPAAETLALRVITILTENGRPSAPLVALVKSLTAERNLDARFLIPIIGEMDKADIIKHLPKIVSMLNGKPEEKNIVRSVFGSIVSAASGTMSSNLPRVRQSELLTPAELMIVLHETDEEIGIKAAVEAIGLCFSMTDVFTSETLATVMTKIVDHATLPLVFMRTVIQAVTTYKGLVGFVSGSLLSRLITKKIWTNPPLWDGFIRCAKIIAPSSFAALLQLPKEQLRDIVDRNPGLRSGLRDHVIKKAGGKARVAPFLEAVFGEDPDSKSPTPQPAPLPVPELS